MIKVWYNLERDLFVDMYILILFIDFYKKVVLKFVILYYEIFGNFVWLVFVYSSYLLILKIVFFISWMIWLDINIF